MIEIKKINRAFYGITIILLLLLSGGCSVKPIHPAIDNASLSGLLPVRKFVANVDHVGGFSISPDGKNLAWQGVSRLKPSILWRTVDGKKVTALRFKKASRYPMWASDSRHILYEDDPSGRENQHVFVVDTLDSNLERRDLTPYPGVKAFVVRIPRKPSDYIFVMHNRRNASVFDLYSINISSGEETLLFENNSGVIRLLVDDNGTVKARIRQTEQQHLLEVLVNDHWRLFKQAGKFDALYPIEITSDGKTLYFGSNLQRDKTAIFAADLVSNKENLIFEHEDVDINGALISSRNGKPLLAYATPGYPEILFADAQLKRKFSQLAQRNPGGVYILSMDRNEEMATLSIWDHTGDSYYLANLQTGETQLLAESAPRKLSPYWVETEPVEFTASDGLMVNGYITRPQGQQGRALPTVLLVHGGPWARDWWGHISSAQFYANRGYTVLQVNYRGSTGYGKAYRDAAEGEFAGKMHQDLLDAVDWAVDQGYSDPNKVAIVGGSYGGYAVLVGMAMTPGKFACGVDNVGVSDLATLIEDFPPYWKPWLHFWHKYVGDPNDPAQRRIMDKKSPLNYAHQVEGPILIFHGVNDPRVRIDQSDRMVAALRKHRKQVEYVIIEDEGHGSSHWKNQLHYYRKVEDFLATCLGGRSTGFDFYQLGSWAF